MKKILMIAVILVAADKLSAQYRNYLSNFQFFQSMLNPAMTGFDGTKVNAAYRYSQWVGFDGAPKTYVVSSDFNYGNRHSFGLSLIQNSFGPYKENQAYFNYGIHVMLTRNIKLRAGAAVTLDMQRIDFSALQMNQQNDPAFQNFTNVFNKSFVADLNVGMAITGELFYLGYALQNASRAVLSTQQDFFNSYHNFGHTAQGGFRFLLSRHLGIVANGLYRFDNAQLRSIEAQIKAVFYNTLWTGVGYRADMAYVGLVGFYFNQTRVSFAYELPTHVGTNINSKTSELALTYKFTAHNRRSYGNYKKSDSKTLRIW